jgi:hypothetical protein
MTRAVFGIVRSYYAIQELLFAKSPFRLYSKFWIAVPLFKAYMMTSTPSAFSLSNLNIFTLCFYKDCGPN